MKLRCPVCRGAFSWDPGQGFPDNCQIDSCGVYIGTGRSDDDITMPSISKMRSAIGGKHDVYRQLEESSVRRAEAAAEAAGVPVSEMSNLKVTNLSDRRDTEIAEAPVVNSVTQQMDAINHANPNSMMGFGANGAQYSGQVQTGPFPNAGAKTRTLLQSQHSGNVARSVGVMNPDVVSDRPAEETRQPGYRIRG